MCLYYGEVTKCISENRVSLLMLLYVHRGLQLDYDKIMDIYVLNHPRRL